MGKSLRSTFARTAGTLYAGFQGRRGEGRCWFRLGSPRIEKWQVASTPRSVRGRGRERTGSALASGDSNSRHAEKRSRHTHPPGMAVSRLPPTAHSVRSFQSSVASKDNGTSGARSQIAPGTTLAKRLLFPHLGPDAEVPPLLSSPNLPPELNAEIYDFIALALRAFVNPWWTKISRYDKEFLVQINQIATQVVRSLETRLSNTDLSPLVFRDLPTIITQHYEDYRLASFKLNTSYSIGGAASLPQLFHQFQPHMAVSADGSINEDYLRQSVDFILKACLSSEDYDPEAERYMTREVILKVLMGAIPRISQPWFIHKLALDLLGASQATTLLEKVSIFLVARNVEPNATLDEAVA